MKQRRRTRLTPRCHRVHRDFGKGKPPPALAASRPLPEARPLIIGLPLAGQADFVLGRVTCATVILWLIPQFSHWNECNSAPSSRSGCAWRWRKHMVPRQTGHVGCSSPVSGFLDDKEIIGVSPGLPVICGLECRSEFAVNESVYCFAENRYGSATLGT
jgi:hypothetical protein